MSRPAKDRGPMAFLVDVDNTLLDNDRIAEDLKRFLGREIGAERQRRYWAIFEERRSRLGYADYLGALQRYRAERPLDLNILAVSSFLIDYPFADRLYPKALAVMKRLKSWGPTFILSDGDAVFQPRKIERSGLSEAVEGEVLLYIHKERELEDVERRCPARRYVLIDDKVRILAAVKKVWGERVTTVFPRQGHYARDRKALAAYRTPDVVIKRIGDLLGFELPALEAASFKRSDPPLDKT